MSNAGGSASGGGFRRLPSVADVLPTLLLLLAEGGWIAVIYIFLEAAKQEAPLLPPVPMALLLGAGAGVGFVAGHEGPRRAAPNWPLVALALVVVAAVLGWLLAGGTRTALTSLGPLPALARHPGGWLLGLAFYRGTGLAQSRSLLTPGESPVAVGIPAIVVTFLLGGAIGQPNRDIFVADALPDALVAVGAGLVGLALARVRAIGAGAPLDWRRNPAYLGLLLVISTAILVVALPASYVVGPALLLLMAALPVTLLLASLFFGIDWRVFRILAVFLGLAVALVFVIRSLAASRVITLGPGVQSGSSAPVNQVSNTVTGVIVVLAIAVVVGILAILTWMRRVRPRADYGVDEERVIERDDEAPVQPWWKPRLDWLPHRRPAPRNAIEAYLAAIAALGRVQSLRRLPTETPAEHARRVRTALGEHPDDVRLGRLAPALGRLEVDYELARFGARPLTGREDRRGIERFAEIRRAIGRLR